LSRLENAEVSPTTDVLGKLCAAYSMSLTRLLSVVEANFRPLVPRASQVLWTDTASGFTRRAVSPPTPSLAAEIVECELQPGTSIVYEAPPVPGQEHHLVMMEGGLELTVDDVRHILKTGDCLRYQLFGKTEFRTSETQSARYFLVLI
jgi:transcriptional regulator with XRE-family HTH domain